MQPRSHGSLLPVPKEQIRWEREPENEGDRTPTTRSSYFVSHSYDYRLIWVPLSPITIMN